MRISVKALERFLERFKEFRGIAKTLKNVKRGRVTFTLHADDGSKTEIPFNFTLSHAADDVAFEEEVTYEAVPDGVEDADIEREIVAIRARMFDYCLRFESQQYWDDLSRELPQKLHKGLTARDLELTHMGVRAASQYGFGAHLYSMILIEAFCIDGMRALKQGDLVQAWYCLGRAQRWSSDDALPADPKQQGQEKARNAATVRSKKNFGWVRDEVVRRLENDAPADGWTNAHATSEELEPYMLDFIARAPASTNLKPENIKATLYRWIREHSEVKAAFERKRKKPTG